MRMKGYNKATKQEKTKLQSQLSNSNTRQNLRNVKRCESHHFEEDREVTMGDDREKKSSVNRMVNLRDFLYSVPWLNSHLFCERKVNGISTFGEQPGTFINLMNLLSENYTSCI